ncbi:hypothetical protein [Streptomyces sp. NPDC085540]|uniref:hypothetical protein n=1 Tax=Streptomyces sp. NPDC085540 TaxID=3365730 RepID=UPI0037D7B47A
MAEPGWPAFAATLADALRIGRDPASLTAEATRRQELDTAASISDVLVWRLRHSAHLPGTPAQGSLRAPFPAPATQLASKAASEPVRRL